MKSGRFDYFFHLFKVKYFVTKERWNAFYILNRKKKIYDLKFDPKGSFISKTISEKMLLN